MVSVLLLAVNRHQERYFSAIADGAEDINIRVVHDNNLPALVYPRRLSATEKEFLHSIAALRLKTAEQESPGYRVSRLRRVFLQIRYYIETYVFFLRAEKFFADNHFDLVGLWSGMKWRQKIVRYVIGTTRTLFFENGAFPATTTVDAKGVNYGSSIPRNPDFYLQREQSAVRSIPQHLTERKPRKELGTVVVAKPLPERYIFVPFQVDSDTQIVEYSPWIKNMAHLYDVLREVSDSAGDGPLVFVIKEHPSSKNDYAYLHGLHMNIVFHNQANTQSLIEKADAVVTINSSVGFEAILLNKPVITLGNAFYNIEGLALHADDGAALKNYCYNFSAPDPELRQAFLNHLYGNYYIQGDWRDADASHIEAIRKVISNTLEH